MKTTFTLLLILSLASAKAQINEGFENTGGLDYYTANGWAFYGASMDYNKQMVQQGNIYIIPSTSTVNNNHSNSNTTQIVTPSVNFTNGGQISFNYKLAGSLGNNQERTMKVRLLDAAGVSTTLYTFTITGTTPAGVMQTSPTINVLAGTGNRRVVIDFIGKGDGNADMFFDNLSMVPHTPITVTPLPTKLLAFNGSVDHKKVRLEWKVAANETGEYFEVQKSADGKTYTTIKMMFTSEIAGIENYQVEDVLERCAYYRLYIVNKDRSVDYSRIIKLNESSSVKEGQPLRLLQNPIQQHLHFTFSSTQKEQNTISLYTQSGIKIYATEVMAQMGINTMNLPLDHQLQKGLYILEVRSATAKRTITVVK